VGNGRSDDRHVEFVPRFAFDCQPAGTFDPTLTCTA
jgi:hypothetical protein